MKRLLFTGTIFLSMCFAGEMVLKSPEAPFVTHENTVSASRTMTLSREGISFGRKQVYMSSNDFMRFLKDSKTIFSVECRAETRPRAWRPFRQFSKTLSDGCLKGEHEFIISGENKGVFRQTLEIVNGRIRISLACDPKGCSAFLAPIWTICFPKSWIQGKTLHLDAQELQIPDRSEWGDKKDLWVNMKAPFVSQIGIDDFSIQFPQKTGIIIFRSRDGIQFRFRNPGLQTEFFLNPGHFEPESNTDVVAGINFRTNNDFAVPVYHPNGNLLMNPSFLSGMRYLRIPPTVEPESLLCKTESKFGKYSARPGFSLFSLPVQENAPYTFSFYAKSLDGKSNTVTVSGSSYIPFKTPPKRYTVSGSQWKRFEYVFRQPSTAVSLSIRGSRDVVLDGLQLEQGERASIYQGSPFGLEMKTDSPFGSLVEHGSVFNARLLLRGPQNETGKAEVEISDFFKRRIFRKVFDFSIPENGECYLKLLEDHEYPRGVNIIKVKILPTRGRAYTDYLRLTVIKYADNTKKNKNLHAAANVAPWTSITHLPQRYLDRMMKCAIGAVEYADRRAWLGLQDHLSPAASALYEKYRIENLGHYLTDTALKKMNGKSIRIPVIGSWELQSDGFFWNQIKPGGYSDSFFQKVEEACFQLAKQHPEVRYWNTASEPDGTEMLRKGLYEEYAKFMLACYRGVKRANSGNLYRGAGACNMGEQGQQTVIQLLSAAQKLDPAVRFDVIDIHPYRPFPEMPDVEKDFQIFLKRLEQIGYGDIKINLGEGAYFYPLIVSQWLDISPWASTTGSKDRYGRLLLPSYDLGWGERVGAAMIMRYWLFAYKYKKHLLSAATWCPMLLDHEHPFAWMAMSSALNDILGNAEFRKDIRFFPGAKSYLFEDEKGRAVAAVWYFEEEMDRGMKNASRMEFSSRAFQKIEFLDMMGNPVTTEKKGDVCILPLSNFPFFIRTEKGSLDALAEALAYSSVHLMDRLPVQFSFHLVSPDTVRATAENLLSREQKLRISVGNSPEKDIVLPIHAKMDFPVKPAKNVSDSGITELSIPISMRIGKTHFLKQFKSEVLGVRYVRDSFQWEEIPEIPFMYRRSSKPENTPEPGLYRYDGEKDFSAKLQIAWNEKALFLRIAVRDDHLICDPHVQTRPDRAYASDGVQVFFDCFGDGKNKAALGIGGFDENDCSYEFLPVNQKQALVYRRHAPDTQLTGGVLDCLMPHSLEKNVTCTFSWKNGVRLYEIIFPARYLMPMSLKAGATPGIGIVIFDRDSLEIPEKQILLLNRNHPFQRPDANTTLLLLPPQK